jgi:histidinol dehydrogenase
VSALLPSLSRGEIIRDAFAFAGGVLHTDTLDAAIVFANMWAAEHLLLALTPTSLESAFGALRGAGTVFIGESASVAFGDYMTGANHVLPTGGLSRCYSGLSTLDFIRWTSWQRVTPVAAASLASDVGVFADSEGLPNHAATARQWSSAT